MNGGEEREGGRERREREREVMMWTRPPSSTAGCYEMLELLGSAAQTSDRATP